MEHVKPIAERVMAKFADRPGYAPAELIRLYVNARLPIPAHLNPVVGGGYSLPKGDK